MRTVPTRRLLLAAVACAFAAAGGAGGTRADADDERDQDRARRALLEGRARPLAEILEGVRGRLGGEVVGVSFEREKRRFIYEFKVVTPSGRLREVYVDAATGEILKSEDD